MDICNRWDLEFIPYGDRAKFYTESNDCFQDVLLRFIDEARDYFCATLLQNGKAIIRKRDYDGEEDFIDHRFIAKRRLLEIEHIDITRKVFSPLISSLYSSPHIFYDSKHSRVFSPSEYHSDF